ncbi:Pentatricopeptide repeat-containing protein [Platanthera zijinensis]|uniref:Pentatricopeptide repeat-containing protein n=1 Tax=Platanthera zijinensis TaxID=2320716 RepID=A0AAP0AWM0_9ASPA
MGTYTYNSLIALYAKLGSVCDSVSLFDRFVYGDIVTWNTMVSSLAQNERYIEMLDFGKAIHAFSIRNDGLCDNSFVGSALVDLYCKFGEILKARINEFDEEALELFIVMEEAAGFCPNATTLASVLPSCVRSQRFSRKEGIHGYVLKRGLGSDKYVLNALMDMYSRVGKIETSWKIFSSMEARDVVTWNTMITGCVVSGQFAEAFKLL